MMRPGIGWRLVSLTEPPINRPVRSYWSVPIPPIGSVNLEADMTTEGLLVDMGWVPYGIEVVSNDRNFRISKK